MGVYEKRMGSTFRARGTVPSDWSFTGFVKQYGEKAMGSCQLCGHTPISQGFEIMTKDGNGRLLVGSECIGNYVYADVSDPKRKAEKEAFVEKAHMAAKTGKVIGMLVKQTGVSFEDATRLAESREWEIRTILGNKYVGYLEAHVFRVVNAMTVNTLLSKLTGGV